MRVLFITADNQLRAYSIQDAHIKEDKLFLNEYTEGAKFLKITFPTSAKAREALIELVKTGFLDATNRKTSENYAT